MTIQSDLKRDRVTFSGDLLRQSVNEFEKAQKKHVEGVRFLSLISSILTDLPEATDEYNVYSHLNVFSRGPRVSVSYSTSSEEDSNVVRGLVQKVMSMPASRKVSEFGGDVSWIFCKDFKDPSLEEGKWGPLLGSLEITINHGRLAPGCEIVQVETTYQQFKIVCPEGSEDSEFLGAGV